MNTLRIIGFAMILFFLFAFKSTSACEYAGSNINFVKTQTEKAIEEGELNLIRYHAFKALNAIEKSKKQMSNCNCEYASISIDESAYLLKRATRSGDVKVTKKLLQRALKNTLNGMEALKNHDKQHTTKKREDLLAINDDINLKIDDNSKLVKKVSFKERIDLSLEKYSASLDHVVQTVNCKDAKAYAENIYKNCEQELLKEGLSEGKKYYNLRTKDITADALRRIEEKCSK